MQCNNGFMSSMILATPHFVRLNVPEHGFGDGLDVMIQFCLERGEELRTGWSTKADHSDLEIYFYFRCLENAEDFAERFGGEIFEPTTISRRDQGADLDL